MSKEENVREALLLAEEAAAIRKKATQFWLGCSNPEQSAIREILNSKSHQEWRDAQKEMERKMTEAERYSARWLRVLRASWTAWSRRGSTRRLRGFRSQGQRSTYWI
jgi:hypothetical protein